MIGFLRFVGLLNAAVWFGSAIFFTLGAGPAIFSNDMRHLLEDKNYPYFSGAIAQIIIARYFRLQIVCGLIALAHLGAEWLYLGRSPQKPGAGLLTVLLVASLIGAFWLQPKMKRLHTIKYAVNTTAANRQAASESNSQCTATKASAQAADSSRRRANPRKPRMIVVR